MEISENLSGLLLVDKPYGWTSFDCTAWVRGILLRGLAARGFPLKWLKVGHCGTLDPFATGLLVLGIGKKGTARMNDFLNADKTYIADIGFGIISPTYDLDSSEISLAAFDSDAISPQKALDALRSFIGEIEQVPPQFSAVKIDGKRAYEYARAGKQIELRPRNVKIYDIGCADNEFYFTEIIERSHGVDLPKSKSPAPILRDVTFHVSKGTYIRSLVRDLGEKLSTSAALVSLKRTSISLFGSDTVYSLDDEKCIRLSKETTFPEIVEKMVKV